MASLACIILAAGEGRRFRSKFPKPLQKLCGRTILDHVLEGLGTLNPDRSVLVIGIGRDQVYEAMHGRAVDFAVQDQQLGTGHAALAAEEQLKDFDGTILVTCADIPLMRPATLQRLIDAHRARGATATILTAISTDPTGYGRIMRSRDGRVRAIIEHRDATDEIRMIQEINAGIYCFEAKRLFEELHQVRPDNAQGEYYLPDVVGRFVAAGDIVTAVQAEDENEVMGINTRQQLAAAEKVARNRSRQYLLDNGVSLIDPETVYVDMNVTVGQDTVISQGVSILGDSEVGEDCEIGPYASIINSRIGNGTRIQQGAVIRDSVVGDNALVGNYSHIRSNSQIGNGSLVGNFVELVRSELGNNVTQLHFSYLGDTQVENGVNIGAGAITCNFDGTDKHKTHIESNAFIGSDAVLIAPINIGEGAYVAAGSAINEDVPAGSLAIARERQVVKENWAGPKPKSETE